MLSKIIGSVVGTKNDRELKRMRKVVSKINAHEATIQALSDEQLQQKTEEFKARHQKGESLDALLPEAFAVCREASLRVNGMRHYDVQLIGGITLHEGKIAEMKTGEGKTLMGTLAMYLNAISGKGVHLVTVNDYLAARDAELNRPLFSFLGMTVGVIYSQQPPQEKIDAYQADITYGTNNEYGFDYLRDNMVFSLAEKKQRPLNFCIIDEIDSILIDEARTPLIISGQAEDSSRMYALINTIIPVLIRSKDEEANKNNEEEDFWIDEKNRQIEISEKGYEKIERFLIEVGELGENESLYSPSRLPLLAHVQAAIRAHHVFVKNVHYIVDDGEVVIVDENTGRTMPGRRWSEGLHQAVEAKENVEIQAENQTLATTTFQNYFRLYDKLSGMTGTADTEAAEFKSTYDLDVIVIPTHEPIARIDMDDQIFLTKLGKYKGIIREIKEIQAKGAPVLVGTATIEASEELSYLLDQEGVKHNVLNAKQHEREAEIIAQAGSPKAVTIATNMAGRGTDIKLGQGVKESGGLAIIGTERHESRRVDRQLRGRAGRQGDPGSSQFFVSLEDDLMRMFGSERISKIMDRLGIDKGEMIQHSMISKSIERAQRKVEENNFGIRKRLLEYDDVMNSQREVIYKKRRHALYGERLAVDISNMMYDLCDQIVADYTTSGDYEGFRLEILKDMALTVPISEKEFSEGSKDDLTNQLFDHVYAAYRNKMKLIAEKAFPVIKQVYENESRYENIAIPITDGMRQRQAVANLKRAYESGGREITLSIEKSIVLSFIDDAWKEHLREMDDLKQSVQNATYEQKDPLLIYKLESFELFKGMVQRTNRAIISFLIKANLPIQEPSNVREAQMPRRADRRRLQEGRDDLLSQSHSNTQQKQKPQPVKVEKKVGRNEMCPCGSGKKYKNCHGRGAE